MMKQKLILFLIFLFCTFFTEAQTVLLNYDKDLEPKYEKGPNQKKFTQGLMRIGFILPVSGEEIEVGSSLSWGMGIRKKFKICALYSLGWEFQFDFTDYKFKNKSKQLSSFGTPVDTRRFDISSISLGQFNRFNFDLNRGNFLGTYLDLGISGRYCYSMKEVYKYETGFGSAKTEIDDLDYVNNLQSEVFARLGYSHISIWSAYRFTDLFKSTSGQEEMPRIVLGLEVGLF